MNETRMPAPPRRAAGAPLMVLAIATLVLASFDSLDLQWGALFAPEAAGAAAEFVAGFAPPDLEPGYLARVGVATLETLAMSALGTLLAVAFGLAIALLAAGRLGRVLRSAARLLLNLLRSIPELAWATLLLVAAGLGPFAGTLALALHTGGVLGRLFADALENAAPLPEQALRTNGVGAVAAFLYAHLPQTLPQMLSYTLYRWENNIRAAAVLGVVGAGGLGQMLKYQLSLFQMQGAVTVLIAMLLLVAAVDGVSYILRRAVTR